MSSERKDVNFYDLDFDKLTYLELHDVRINENSNFLKSNNIDTLFLYYRDGLDYFRRELEDLAKMNKKFGFLKLLTKLKKLKHLNIRNKLTVEFFQNWTQILSNIEILSVHIKDVKTMLYINNEFPNLKILDVYVFESLDKFCCYLSPICLNGLMRKLRKDLQVYLYNIPLKQENIDFICDFLVKSKNQIKLCNSELSYIVDENCEQMMEKHRENQHLLEQFYSNINLLFFQRPYFNSEMYRKMYNVEYLTFNFKKNHCYGDFYKYLETFNNLKELRLLFDFNQFNGNQILKYLPFYCSNVFSLTVRCSNQTNFDFSPLLKLTNLKYLKLTLIKPVEEFLFIQLIQNLNYLTFFEMNFDRTPAFSEYQIQTVQTNLRRQLDQVLIKKKLAFSIEVQQTLDSNLVFFTLKKIS